MGTRKIFFPGDGGADWDEADLIRQLEDGEAFMPPLPADTRDYPVTDWRHAHDVSTPVDDLPEVPW